MPLDWPFHPTRSEVADALTAHGAIVAISDTESDVDEIEMGFADGTVVRMVAKGDCGDTYFGYAIGTPRSAGVTEA